MTSLETVAPGRLAVRRLPRPRLRRLPAVRGGFAVLAATLLWHGSNFAFNSVAARMLGPSGYSELAATVALLYVASPVLVSIQTMTSRTVTSLRAAGGTGGATVFRGYRNRLLLAGLIATVVAFAISDSSAHLLHVHSGLAIAIVVLGLSVSLLTHCQRGVLQGEQQFKRYALSTSSEAIAKVIGAVLILGFVRRDVDGAVAAIPLAAVFTLAVNGFLLRPLAGKSETRSERVRMTGGQPVATILTFAFLAVLLSADVIAAKRFLPSHEAGLYAAVSLCGKTTFFVTSFVSILLFPTFTARREAGQGSRRLLAWSLAGVLATAWAIAALYFVAPEVVVDPLFGSQYSAADAYVGWIGLAFGCYGVMYLSAMYLLAAGRRIGGAILAVVVGLQLAALLVEHRSVAAIVTVQLVVLALGATTLALVALIQRDGAS